MRIRKEDVRKGQAWWGSGQSVDERWMSETSAATLPGWQSSDPKRLKRYVFTANCKCLRWTGTCNSPPVPLIDE